jgi:diguanylate cyclase (GGDEF)-like protein
VNPSPEGSPQVVTVSLHPLEAFVKKRKVVARKATSRKPASRKPHRKVVPKAMPKKKSPAFLKQPLLEKEMWMIHEVAALMRQGLSYYEALKLVLKCVAAALRCERAEIFLVDEHDQTLGREISIGADGRYETGSHTRVPLGEQYEDPFSRLIFGKVEFITNADLSDRLPVGSSFNVKVPIRAAGRVLGVLSVDYRGTARPKNKSEVLALLTFATQVGFILENIRLHFEIIQLAFKDELTGQYNHRFWIKRLQEEVDRSVRYKHVFSVLVVGLDGFSKFNETYGFALGDRVLRDMGAWLKKIVRTCDLVARPGGDLFFVLLPETNIAGGSVVAEKMRKGIEQFEFAADPGLRQIQNHLTASVGMAGYPEHGLMIEQVMERLNLALHKAKGAGGNRLELADPIPPSYPPRVAEGPVLSN